jgi:hypothetical protein
MKTLLPAILLALSPIPALSQSLTLAGLPALVLAKDSTVVTSVQSSLLAFHVYMGSMAQVWPQVDFSSSYGLQYTPRQQTESIVLSSTPPFTEDVQDITSNDVAGHSAGGRLSVSQVLPTAGSLSLMVEDQMTAYTYGSRTTETSTGTTTANPEAQYMQKPKLTLQLTQPLFFNGKIIDFDLFPATLRKAQIGYQKADLARQSATNRDRKSVV